MTTVEASASWAKASLAEVLVAFESGSRPKGGVRGIDEGIPSIGGEHLNASGGFRFENLRYVPVSFFERMTRGRIQEGDILVVKDGATTGKVSLVRSDFPFETAGVNEHVFICRPSPEVSSKFVFYFLFSQQGQQQILANFRGAAQGGITQDFASKVIVPLAPLAEQQRIVAEIEKHLTRLDAAIGALQRVRANLKRYRASVLKAAVEGRLVPTRPVDPSTGLPAGWLRTTLGKVLLTIQNGLSRRRGDVGTPTRVLRLSDIENGRIREDSPRLLPLSEKERKTYQLEPGDVLSIRVNGSRDLVGRLIPFGSANRWTFCDHFIRLKPDTTAIEPSFLDMQAETQDARRHIELNMVSSAGQNTVSQVTLASLPIILPSISEQRRIIEEVGHHMSVIDALEVAVENALRRAGRLRQSLLKRAFEGRLVLQDPNDEPASVLLERILAERETAPMLLPNGRRRQRRPAFQPSLSGTKSQ